MTKRLEELFNLNQSAKEEPVVEKPAPKKDHSSVKTIDDSYQAVQEITRSLPAISELNDLDDSELDKLATKAEQAYDDLMDLGMNVEVRYASRIFEVAGGMLKTAVDAKTAKVDKKLKAIDLQLKKYKIDKDNNEDPGDVLNGAGYVVLDRNEMLKKLGQKS
jgi:hypothetical protein